MKKKNNLDEAQELKMLKIEHNTCWLAYFGLLIAIVIQTVLNPGNFAILAGEWIVFMAMCLYMCVACLKNGIWDRRIKPTPKANLIGSLIAGTVVGVVWFIISYRNYHKLIGSLATAAFTFLFTSVPAYLLMSLSAKLYKNRVKKLEDSVKVSADPAQKLKGRTKAALQTA